MQTITTQQLVDKIGTYTKVLVQDIRSDWRRRSFIFNVTATGLTFDQDVEVPISEFCEYLEKEGKIDAYNSKEISWINLNFPDREVSLPLKRMIDTQMYHADLHTFFEGYLNDVRKYQASQELAAIL